MTYLSGMHESRKPSLPAFPICSVIVFKNLQDFFHGAPRTRRRGDAEDFLDLAEVADCFHLAAINSEDELLLDLQNLQQPIFFRRQAKRNRRQFVRLFVQHACETSDVRTRRLPREWIFACSPRRVRPMADKIGNRFRGNNHDLAFEG